MENTMTLTLKVWRQNGPAETGRFETYEVNEISPDMSFLEMFATAFLDYTKIPNS